MNYVRELKVSYKGRKKKIGKMENPKAVYQFFKKYSKELQEHFVVVYLNNKNSIVGWSEISKGTVSEAIVHPREVFLGAILSNASSVIVCHNHPTGDTEPSKEDIAATGRLAEAGKILGIPLLDHVIIGHKTFYSMKEGGHNL